MDKSVKNHRTLTSSNTGASQDLDRDQDADLLSVPGPLVLLCLLPDHVLALSLVHFVYRDLRLLRLVPLLVKLLLRLPLLGLKNVSTMKMEKTEDGENEEV